MPDICSAKQWILAIFFPKFADFIVGKTIIGCWKPTKFTDRIYYNDFIYKISGINIRTTDFSNTEISKRYLYTKKYVNIIKAPAINVKVKRNGEVIFDKNFTITFNYNLTPVAGIEYSINSLNINSQLNILKNFYNRIYVGYILEIQILESRLEIQGETYHSRWVGNNKDGYTKEEHLAFNGVIFNLTLAHFKGLSITASAETSTLSNATGSGEVQYIAMEVD